MTQIVIRDASVPFNVELGSALPGFVLDLEPIWAPA
jgi:hypothetical protein